MSQQPPDADAVPLATATVALLLASGVARVVAVLAPGNLADALPLAVGLASVEVLVPFVLAGLHLARCAPAASGTIALAALGAGQLMSVGVGAMTQPVALQRPLVWLLVAAGLQTLAGATIIGRWQDHGAPAAGPGPGRARMAAAIGALLLGASLVTTPVAVLGRVTLGEGSELPGPVALATTVSLERLPLLLAVLLVTGWAATRSERIVLHTVCLVLATRAVARLGADLSIQRIEPAPLLLVLSGGAVVLLLGAALALRRPKPQVTSSSA